MKLVPLGDLLELSDSGVWGNEDANHGVSVLRSTNFNTDGTLDLSKLTFRALEERNRTSKLLRPGDILLEKSGGGPKQPVGRVCLFQGDSRQHSFGNFIARLRPKSTVLSEYLFYFLWYFHSIGRTSHYQKQTTGIRNLEQKRYLTIQVPLVSLNEQRQIVDLLSRAEGIVKLRRAAKQKAAAITPALFVDMFGDPITNPKNLPTKSLGELVAFVSGGTPSKARDDFWIGDLPWVSPKDMKTIALYDATDHLNQAVLSETNLKLIPVGSVLIVVRGMILIHTVPVAHARVPLTINQDMKALVPRPSIDSAYLLWALKVSHSHLLNMVSTAAHGTKKLDTARLEELVIPLPPLDVQRAFGVNLARIESVQTQQRAAQSRAEATFRSLLARAFSANDRRAHDEPLEVAVA
jgi:type I restriction enzyme, S subunit